MMKKCLPLLLIIIAFVACSKSTQAPHSAKLEKIFQHIYSLEKEGIESLSLEISGNHESVKNFLADLNVDSGKIIVYWKKPFELKTHVFSKTGAPVDLPRWLDFGFAFGIFYGTDLVPILARPGTEIQLLENIFNLNSTGILKEETTENNNLKFVLEDPAQPKKSHTIITDKDYFPLNSYGSRLFEGKGQVIEIDFTENWIKLPNNKAVTSYREQRTRDKSRKRLEHRIKYKKIKNFWLPSEITERKRATQRGKIQKQDTRLVYDHFQINPVFDDALFEFEQPANTKSNFSTPDSTLQSLLRAARGGDINQMRHCFSREMKSQFEALTNQAHQGIRPFAIIPGETLKKIQDDVTRWVFGSYVERIEKLNSTLVNQTSGKAILTVDYEGESSLFRGEYQLVKESDGWKIDTNPHVIFKISE